MQIEKLKKMEERIKDSEFEIKETHYYKIKNWIQNNGNQNNTKIFIYSRN